MNFRRVQAPGLECAAARRRGFALLITITLLAFLVLLLVSLATLTRVETQVAGNAQKLSVARQNALVALNLALGQLQKYAGPDQRVTATADIGGAAGSVNGISAPMDGKRHWVGVWGRDSVPAANTGSPVLLNWLVSGNEKASFTATNGAPPYSGVTGIQFVSTGGVASLVVGSTALSELGTTAQPWRLLVGSNSAGADVTRYVAAPLMPITFQSNQIPGLGGAGDVPIGRYAWWVGDENVKARVNLYNRHLGGVSDALGSSFVLAQRLAVEWVDRDDGTVLETLYPALSSSLSDVLSLPQLALASSDPTTMGATIKRRFHDLTAHSYSVLADVAEGGLKKDLNRALAANAPLGVETARGADYAPLANRDWLFSPNGTDSYGVPTWGLLRSYAGKQVAPKATVGVKAPVRGAFGSHFFYDEPGISPVVTYGGVGIDFTSPGADLGADPAPTYPSPINLNLFPVVVLWNPYTVPLAAGDYTVAIGARSAFPVHLRETNASGAIKATLQLHRASFATSGSPAFFRFKLVCPVIEPGRSVVFGLAANEEYRPGLTELVPGLNTLASAWMNSGASLADAAQAAKDYYVHVTNSAGGNFGGGEIDVVLAEFDPTGMQPSGQDPEVASTAWYSTVQRVGSDASSPVTPGPAPLHPDTTAGDIRFAMRVRANFPADSGSGMQLQWIAHASARSPIIARSKVDSWTKADGSTAGYTTSYAGRFGVPVGTPKWPDFATDSTTRRASAGTALTVATAAGLVDATLWEFPTPALGLLSLGQLQHAPVSILGTYPSYAIGNSLADFRIPRSNTLTAADTHPTTSGQMVTARIGTYYDLSWHLNRTLWDRYFFSSVPTGAAPSAASAAPWEQAYITAGDPLPNSRLHYYQKAGAPPDLAQLRHDSTDATSDPFNQAAANLLIAGGFNVNSTSEQAWRAVLAGVNKLTYDPENPASSTSTALLAAFSRFTHPTAGSTLPASSAAQAGAWQGYRQLTEAQLGQLARNIVAEVRLRGPFLSLADFVNRRLAADATGLKGALQAAIDATTTGGTAVNLATTAPFNSNRVDKAPGTGETYDAEAMRNDASNTINAAHRSRSAFAPKFLTQADVLSTIGPSLAARSDTFVVRAYGESVNPVLATTDAGYVTGRAWCEAVVQRVPDYVDPNDPALTAHNLRDAVLPSATNQTNQSFGRRFKVISFRWMNASEI